MMHLLEQIRTHAWTAGSQIAYQEIYAGQRALTYAELWVGVNSFARHLANTNLKGQIIILCLLNRLEYPVAFLGALAAGCDVFPISPEVPAAELRSLAKSTKAAGFVGLPANAAALRDNVNLVFDADEILAPSDESNSCIAADAGNLFLCSSGTTGRPKIVVRSAPSMDAVAANTAGAVGFSPTDHVLSVIPLCHSYGLEHGLFAPLWAGSSVHLATGLDFTNLSRHLMQQQISILPGVPTIYEMLCQFASPARLPNLRQAYAAGAPLPQAIYDAVLEKLGIRVGQLYGATEIGSVTFNDPHKQNFNPSSVGLPFDGVTVRIVDPESGALQPANNVGEVHVHAPSMFDRYLNEEHPVGDGFFATGDLGRLDRHGNLFITGRLKLLIDIGGLKVNLLEVEEALKLHPAVESAAVIAVRLSETIFRLKAFVISKDAGRPAGPDDLRQFLCERLAPHKVPRSIEVRSSLPRSPTGKILRHALEAL